MLEIHRPYLVECRWFGQRLWPLAYQPFLRLDAQVQFQLPVNPVDTLVVPAVAFNIAQVSKAQAEALVALIRRQTNKPVCNLAVL